MTNLNGVIVEALTGGTFGKRELHPAQIADIANALTATLAPRIVTTQEELAALPLGAVVRAHWPNGSGRDAVVMRCKEGGASSSGYGVADARALVRMAEWGAELTVISTPGVTL